MKNHRFPIGTRFTRRNGKVTQECEVTEQLTVINSKGEVVKCYYEARHLFCGQWVTDHDICDTTIARNLISEGVAS